MGRQGPGACTKATPAEESPPFVEGFAVRDSTPKRCATRFPDPSIDGRTNAASAGNTLIGFSREQTKECGCQLWAGV